MVFHTLAASIDPFLSLSFSLCTSHSIYFAESIMIDKTHCMKYDSNVFYATQYFICYNIDKLFASRYFGRLIME